MGIIAKPTDFTPSTTISSSEVNDNFDTIYNEFNGSIAAANLATSAVTTAKIADSAVTTAKINDLAVTTGKLNDASVTAAKLATAPTRFVAVDPGVSVVSADPANTNWTSVDITTSTSATATAALLEVATTSSDTTRSSYLRPTGTSNAQDATTTVSVTNVANVPIHNQVVQKLDSSQSFDWSVSNASVTNIAIHVKGYWETVA